MESLNNFFEFLRIALILVVGGTAFKVCINLLEGKKIEFNPLNPLNLKARWPRKNQAKGITDKEKN